MSAAKYAIADELNAEHVCCAGCDRSVQKALRNVPRKSRKQARPRKWWKWRKRWKPSGTIQLDSRRYRARQRVGIDRDSENLPKIEGGKYRYDPWDRD